MALEAMTKMGRAYGKFLKTQSSGCYNKYEDFAVIAGEREKDLAWLCKLIILAFLHKKGVRYGTEICPYF